MTVEEISAIDPGNPYLSDPYHMGVTLGTNVTVMYAKHSSEHQDFIIVVDTQTGDRFWIEFPPKE